MPSLSRAFNASARALAADRALRASRARASCSGRSLGFGWLAFSGLLATAAPRGRRTTPPKAKSVIFCFMDGGPSHVDTFDSKPMLEEARGQADRRRRPSPSGRSPPPNRVWLGSPWEFQQRGESGLWVSDLFPHLATVADELCVVRSHGRRAAAARPAEPAAAHRPQSSARPRASARGCRTAWAAANRNLPGYVVLNNDWVPNGGLENFGSSFLPASHQATMMRAKGVPVDNIAADGRRGGAAAQARPAGRAGRRLRRRPPRTRRRSRRPSPTTRPPSACRPRCPSSPTSAASPRRSAGCTASTRRTSTSATTPRRRLRARRLVEAGVRFVEITCPASTATTRRGTSTACSR